ncbi:MAG TPA: cobyric acid synthase [Alphaproteobacteria bacterium]|nr:cobyric acid synthase [Alphaproteobacteria bacterium]
MFQGTGSDVGKSLLVAGLCRAFTRSGLAVRPFKPQNMSNNAAVTVGGGEIGRAQALQARACGIEPTTDMNPILLKPQTEIGAQVIVHGQMRCNATAREFQAMKSDLLPEALASFGRLAAEADIVLIEGAGSAAEINLRQGDIANMGFACAAGIPVALVGDIDRGGVIAQLVGTWALLSEADRAQVAGFVVNKFRGDAALFDAGMTEIEDRTGWPSLGLVPHLAEARLLPAEDAVAVEARTVRNPDAKFRIAVPVLSRIANFDDFDPLAGEPGVALDMVPAGQPLPRDADLIVIPGSKATLADLAFLRDQGWDIDIAAHRRHGGAVLGICAGFQMLGTRIGDPMGIEGPPGEAQGLGVLDVETVLGGNKRLVAVEGTDIATGEAVRGYEMHVGATTGAARDRPMLDLADYADGAVSADGRVMGCYVHGLFAADGFRRAFLAHLGHAASGEVGYEARIEAVLDGLADHLEAHMDVERCLAIAEGYRASSPATSTASAIPARR